MNGNHNTRLLPFHIIEAAASGNAEAINQILKYYEGYIIALSAKRFYDGDGKAQYVIDSEICRTLANKLILKILCFDVITTA